MMLNDDSGNVYFPPSPVRHPGVPRATMLHNQGQLLEKVKSFAKTGKLSLRR